MKEIDNLFGLILKILAIVWLVLAMSTYVFHHPYVSTAIASFDYWSSLGVALSASVVVYWIMAGFKFKLKVQNELSTRLWLVLVPVLFVALFLYREVLTHTVPDSSPIGEFTINFLILSLKHLLMLSGLCLAAFSMGSLVLRRWVKAFIPAENSMVSMAFGFSMLGAIMFFHSLIIPVEAVVLIAVSLICIVLEYKEIIVLFKNIFIRKYNLGKVSVFAIPLFAFVMMFVSISWILAHKLYPMGYDGITLYGNLAHLFGSDGHIIRGFMPYNWSMMMGGLGMRVFGSEAMMFLIGYLPGYLLLPLMYKIARKYVNTTRALVVVVIWLSLPMVMYHYGSTEKVDLALAFIVLAGAKFYLDHMSFDFNSTLLNENKITFKHPTFVLFLLFGWLIGYGMGIKLTAFFIIYAVANVLFYQAGNYRLLKWGFLTLLGAFFAIGIYQITGMIYGTVVTRVFGTIMLAVGLYELKELYPKYKVHYRNIAALILAMVIGVMLSFGPWIIKNGVESNSRNVATLLRGETESPLISIKKDTEKRAELSASAKLAGLVFLGTSRREEMGKFLGFDEGFYKYFSVLYKMSTNPNNYGKIFVDVGIYVLLFLPFFMFFQYSKRSGSKRMILLSIGFWLGFLSISTYIVWTQPGMPDIGNPEPILTNHPDGWSALLAWIPLFANKILNQIGQLLSYIPLMTKSTFRFLNVLLSIGMLMMIRKMVIPFFKTLKWEEKLLLLVTAFFLYLWYITGTGIGWYVFPVLPLLFIAFQIYFEKKSVFWQNYHGVALGIIMIMMTAVRFSGVTVSRQASDPEIVLNGSLLYSSGFMKTQDKLLEATNNGILQASKILNANKNDKIYMVGTLLNYFIDDNYLRIHQDNQLAEFDAITKSNKEVPSYFTKVLKVNGYKYLVFNPSDISYDKTPEQSYRKKFDHFFNYVSNSKEMKLLFTDHEVRAFDGTSIQGLKGETVKTGTLAVLKIL